MKQGLLCFSLILSGLSVQAEADLFDLAAEYNSIKKGVTQLESKKRKILSDIYSIERETNLLVLEKNKIDEKKLKLDGELSKISHRIVEIEHQIQGMIPDLMERLNFTEQVNNLPWFYTFLTSQSLAELDHTVQTAHHINSQQSEAVMSFLDLVNDLEKQKVNLNQTAVEIVKTQKTLKAKEKEIAANQLTKKSRLKVLEKNLSAKRKNLKKVKGKGKRALASSLFSDMGLLFGSSFFDQKGSLPHPVELAITHGYGLNQGLLTDNIQLIHKGYFYKTLQTEPVRSVASGRVRFAGRLTGYGFVVVIDHGSRYYTTYANLKQVSTQTGQEIKQNSVVGVTGHNHLQMGMGAYFEIRHFSQPQNPDQWLKKPKDQLATI